jgi:hypothetical protein
MTKISKILEIENCNKDNLVKAIYTTGLWEKITPVDKIQVEFIAPNVMHSKIFDQIKVVNVPIEMDTEIVLTDKGEEAGKGRLIELNVRNNEQVQKMEARLRIKSLSSTKSKVGIFIDTIIFTNDFISLLGGAADMVFQSKVSDMMRALEKHCKNSSLNEFLHNT